MVKIPNLVKIAGNIYKDQFLWMLVKSYVVFVVGVGVAKEFVGLQLMAPVGSR